MIVQAGVQLHINRLASTRVWHKVQYMLFSLEARAGQTPMLSITFVVNEDLKKTTEIMYVLVTLV